MPKNAFPCFISSIYVAINCKGGDERKNDMRWSEGAFGLSLLFPRMIECIMFGHVTTFLDCIIISICQALLQIREYNKLKKCNGSMLLDSSLSPNGSLQDW